MAHTQDDRNIAIETPLGKDVLLLHGFSGVESLSQPFRFDLDLLSEVDHLVDFDDIVGQNVTITIRTATGERYINGIVTRFAEGDSDETFTSYRAEMVPWLWRLTETADCRIFQDMTVPDIILKIFNDLGYSDVRANLSATYSAREYCVQYRETDFNFVSRLMEQNGIYYYFEHEKGKHTLVLGDSPAEHQPCPLQPVARFQRTVGATIAPDEVVTSWEREQRTRPAKYALGDYNFETPNANLMVSVDSMYAARNSPSLAIFDYPGAYLKRPEGEGVVRTRIEEQECRRLIAKGTSGCGAFTAGYRFDLAEHPRRALNGTYVLTRVTHDAVERSYRSDAGTSGFQYSNRFTCIPRDVPFRPPRATPRPVVEGPQTAVVVGKADEESWIDKFNRVKVQFHWDRYGRRDENASCWMRVVQPWAGKRWGVFFWPRIGQEVVVDFLEGDPDRPVIVGSVYNAVQMPPYASPNMSGVKTNSTPNGKGFNELRFDDTKDKEQVFIHAQRSMDVRVGGSHRHTVCGNYDVTIGYEDDQGGKQGDLRQKIKRDHHQWVEGDVRLKIDGEQHVTIGKAVGRIFEDYVADSITGEWAVSARKMVFEATQSITFAVGNNFVEIGPGGITVNGTLVQINCTPSVRALPENTAITFEPEEPARADTAKPGFVSNPKKNGG